MDIGGWTSVDRRWQMEGARRTEPDGWNQMGRHRMDVDYDIKQMLNRSRMEVK
jgi:hypothetical protein